MVALLVVIAAAVMLRRQILAFGGALTTTSAAPALAPRKVNPQLAQLAVYADRLYAEKKWLAAEKAYLKVLKLDHKNITAYSHLGIIYSAQHNYADAIECFEIAARLRPSGVTQQNLGLAYYENRNYIKSINAFEKAIVFEATATRYIGISKAYKKISNTTQMLAALEKAGELEGSKRVLMLLADAYGQLGRRDEARAVYRRILADDPSDVEVRRILSSQATRPASEA